MSDAVRIEREGEVALVVVDRPPANAIGAAVIAGLREGFAALAAEGTVRAAILTGAGERFFAAGADVSEFPAAGGAAAAGGQELTVEIEALPFPTVAAVNGMALGGGCELAMACDLRIAARHARFGQPEIDLGIIPGWGGTQRLPRLVGRGPAMAMLLTGEPISAEDALRLGLVTAVVDGPQLLDAARALAAKVAAKAPLAVAATRRAVAAGADQPLAHGLAAEDGEFRGLLATEDGTEGIAAFLEKRRPVWRGR